MDHLEVFIVWSFKQMFVDLKFVNFVTLIEQF